MIIERDTVARVITTTLAILAFTACTEERWRADIYPDASNTRQKQFGGEFSTRKDCQQAAESHLRAIGRWQQGFYECGKNCSGSPVANADTLWICKQVVEVRQGVEYVRD